jgi:hypothetical protein
VQFLLDGSIQGTAVAPPYTASLNPASFAGGNHVLSAVATDLFGNSATATIAIQIANDYLTRQPERGFGNRHVVRQRFG